MSYSRCSGEDRRDARTDLHEHRELTRLEILQRIEDRRLNQTQAATMLGMTPRQMRRLVRSYRAQGPEGLVSRKRGKIGNHGGRKPSEITSWR
jgi:DNA-binding NtrC family response regulator